jgi:hypothetical protein
MRLKPVVPYENMAKSMVSELLARSRMEQFRDEWTQQGKLWKKNWIGMRDGQMQQQTYNPKNKKQNAVKKSKCFKFMM